MAKLGDICRFQSGGTPSKGVAEYYHGSIPWITTTALNGAQIDDKNAVDWITEKAIKESAAKIVPARSILVGTRVGVGKVAVNTIAMSTSQDIIALTDIDETTWSKDYLCKYLQGKSAYLNSQSRGATIKGIKIDVLAALELQELPLSEQKQISQVINTVNSIISLRQQEIQMLDDLIKARFVEMFGKSNYPSVALKDITEVITKGTTPTTAGFGFVDDGINFFKIESIMEDHTINHEKVAHVTDECHKAFKRSQLKAGDILFSIAGAIGRTAIITERDLPGNTNQALAIIRLLSDSGLSRRFMISSFESPLVTEQYNRKKRGIAQINLSLQDIGNLVIPVPNQKAQDEFERFAQQVDKSKAAVQKALDEAQLLFDSLMQQYFG